MAEVRALPWNGLRVASLFAGGGGSSAGYRMAGFRVAYANEFDPHAAATYRANMAEGTYLDTRDIREVEPPEVLEAAGLDEGELDVLDGSPPCQTFSTAGKRDMSDARSDLFMDFARVLEGVRPRAFVAENVSGLVKGVAKGYFLLIMERLRGCGYRVRCKALDAQWLGVPQARKRTVFVGVREDLGLEPVFPAPQPYRYSLREAIGLAPGERVYHHTGGQHSLGYLPAGLPAPTVCAGGAGHFMVEDGDTGERRRFTVEEGKRVCSFPPDYLLEGSYSRRWKIIGNSVPPVMMRQVAGALREGVLQPVKNAQFSC